MKVSNKMLLAAQCINYGSADNAWRMKGANPSVFIDSDQLIENAQWAEKGKFHFIFMADHPAVREDLTHHVPSATIDPVVLSSQIIQATEKIGIVLTQSTTFNFPYNVARQLKALDILSKGRIGWNAVTTNDPKIAANYGQDILDRNTRYARAHEFIQIVQALWGSWGEDALKLDIDQGVFADGAQIQPIHLQGEHVASRGPLPIPPSPQGQPVIFQAGGGEEGLQLASMYASGIYSIVNDIESGRKHRENLDEMCMAVGRNSQEVKIFMGINITMGNTYEEALNRQVENFQLNDIQNLYIKAQQLSALVGVQISVQDIYLPLPQNLRAELIPNPYQLHSIRAVDLLKKGMTPFHVIANGVTDFHRTIIGSPKQIADQMQELFEDGACDGFVINNDRTHDGLPAFVEQVIPILQHRELFHEDYEGTTLREHLGIPYQYGRNNK